MHFKKVIAKEIIADKILCLKKVQLLGCESDGY